MEIDDTYLVTEKKNVMKRRQREKKTSEARRQAHAILELSVQTFAVCIWSLRFTDSILRVASAGYLLIIYFLTDVEYSFWDSISTPFHILLIICIKRKSVENVRNGTSRKHLILCKKINVFH